MTLLQSAEDVNVPSMANDELWKNFGIDWLARWSAAGLFAVSSWCAALGALSAGPDTRKTFGGAGGAAGFTLLGAIACGAFAMSHGLTGEATALIGLFVFSGVGVTIGATRRALYEESHRVAAMRFASSVSMLMGVSYAGGAVRIGNKVAAFGPGGLLSGNLDMTTLVERWNDLAAPVITLGWIALAFAFLVAFCGFFWELGEVVERYTLLDVWGVLLILVILGGVRVPQYAALDRLSDISTNAPAVALFDEFGADLSPSLLSVEKEVSAMKLQDGGFGDVLVFAEDAWTRQYKWEGDRWTDDETPMAEATLNERRPLLVITSGAEATALVDALRYAGGSAIVLMRAAETKGTLIVPANLAHNQLTFYEMSLGEGQERNLETELWTAAGNRNYMWGPVKWFGEVEGEEPILYAGGVTEETAATTLHVLITDRNRVKDAINSCLPFQSMGNDDNKPEFLADRKCVLHAEADDFDPEEGTPLFEVFRDEAGEIWELPTSEYTKMRVEPDKLTKEVLDAEMVSQRFLRELAAIDYCINEARGDGEEIEGKQQLTVEVSKKGGLDVSIHERSKLQSGSVRKCTSKRFSDIKFELPEPEEEPEDEEQEEQEEQADAEPEPRPLIEIFFELKTPPVDETEGEDEE
jgi:hypothetical protein